MMIRESPKPLKRPRVVYIFEEMESRVSGSDTESNPRICSAGILMMPFLQCRFENDMPSDRANGSTICFLTYYLYDGRYFEADQLYPEV